VTPRHAVGDAHDDQDEDGHENEEEDLGVNVMILTIFWPEKCWQRIGKMELLFTPRG
jgi:hypothetical protein